MTRIRKRSGIPQDFKKEKLKRSLECAGIPEGVAENVAEQIVPQEDMSTQELRKQVAEALAKVNPAYAAAYGSTRRIAARGSSYMTKGVCRLNEDYMKSLGFHSGQSIMLAVGDRKINLTAEAVESLSSREILLNEGDLNALGISSGDRVRLRPTEE